MIKNIFFFKYNDKKIIIIRIIRYKLIHLNVNQNNLLIIQPKVKNQVYKNLNHFLHSLTNNSNKCLSNLKMNIHLCKIKITCKVNRKLNNNILVNFFH